MSREKRLNQITIRLTDSEAAQLDEITRQGGHNSRNDCARSMVLSILVDERESGALPQERVRQ